MEKRAKLAIVGAGQIADSHAKAALAIPEFELAFVVDPALERARAFAERWRPEARAVAKLGDALGEIDAAVIATPNDSHAPLALECLRAGVAVLVEKPMATNVRGGEEIVAAAEAANVLLAVGYSTRFFWNVQFMKELLQRGELGRPRRFAYQYGFKGGWSSYSGYHLDRQAVGGGVLVTTGTHFLDRVLDWFGYPDRLEYEDDADGGPEANARAGFGWSAGDGLEGSARFSRTVTLSNGICVETDRGVAILREDPSAPVHFRPHGSSYVADLRPTVNPQAAIAKGIFQLQLEEFAEALREQRAPLVDGRIGLASLRLVENLYACRRPLVSDPYYGATESHS